MERDRNKKRNLWPMIYGILLTGYTIFTLLDAFVIPRDLVSVEGTDENLPKQTAGKNPATDSGTIEPERIGIVESTEGGEAPDEKDGEALEDTEDVPESQEADKEPEITDYSYVSENISIAITIQRRHETQVYVADIVLRDAFYLKTGLAGGTFGRNVKELTSAIAEDNGAILAINGDFYGFRDRGFVMRNGYLYRDTANRGAGNEDLVIYEDGRLEIVEESKVSASELAQAGAVQIFSFGPGLVQNMEITVEEGTEVEQAMRSNPRTAIGEIGPLHYVFVVSDGRTRESDGLTLLQLAEFMQELGCQTAYNLDGGGSSTMWFMGEVVNYPTSGKRTGERSVSDIVYIGE